MSKLRKKTRRDRILTYLLLIQLIIIATRVWKLMLQASLGNQFQG